MRITAIVTLLLCISCNGKDEQPKGQGDNRLGGLEEKEACERVFSKMASCRDDVLMLARTGPVLGGALPEAAMESARFLDKAIGGDVATLCAQEVPPDLAQGVDCFDDDCRKMAQCMMKKVEYAPEATGDGALVCGEGLTALEAKGGGKVLQWCVMADGTPHGSSRVLDGTGQVLREQKYDRGRPVHVKDYVRRETWWD